MSQSILIVDDEKEIVSMLYHYFSKLGYTVYTATAGNAALKEVEKNPDIILLDVNMPDIDGFTVCEKIRDYISCPIIFLTARIEDSDKIKGFSIGADDYVIKPFSVDELEARMTNLYRLEDIEMPRQYIQFHSLINSLNETAEALCCDKRFTITSKNDDIALFINLDTVMQIYENLLSNSIRYAKNNITIGIEIQNNDLVISVSDDGCGFKISDIEKATLPFYKSSKEISTEHLGLGLNICKILSERHGGNIQISNNETGGACVTVRINYSES